MQKSLLMLWVLGIWAALGLPAAAQNTTGLVQTTCGSPSVAFKAGNPGPFTLDVNGNLCITGAITVTPVTNQSVNITQILGAAVSNTNPLFVAPSTTAVFASNLTQVNGAAHSVTNPVFTAGAELADATGTFTNATQTTSVTTISMDGYGSAFVSINGTYGTATAVFEMSDDAGTTWYSVQGTRSDGSAAETGYTSLTNTTRGWWISVGAGDMLRVRSTAVASGTVNVRISISSVVNPNASPGLLSAASATLAPVAPATATATKSNLAGCQATSAAINPTTGQQAAINCDLNNNVLVSSGGAPNLATAQVSVTTGNITVAAARALRRAVTITNVTGTSAIYCGNTGVTTSTGMYLGATAGSSITLNTTAGIFCTVAATTQTVTVAETY